MLFVPCKQQADATFCRWYDKFFSCFYLANSRQMQLENKKLKLLIVVFTLQTAGRCHRT
ncbi:Uncharacterised protein [Prevotella intermedia]|nr:Uncharacterised protein [Prevotella intermedia]